MYITIYTRHDIGFKGWEAFTALLKALIELLERSEASITLSRRNPQPWN